MTDHQLKAILQQFNLSHGGSGCDPLLIGVLREPMQPNKTVRHSVQTRFILGLAAFLLATIRLPADEDRCAVCGGPLSGTIYLITDKVSNEKKQICQDCSKLTEICFVCGLPVKTDFTKLPDGRFLCERDARTAVLDEVEARDVCENTRDALDRLLSRFVTFPGTNLHAAVVDRVNLLELFKVPGNDYECPNVLGYIQSKTNHGHIYHDISLLGGLPRATFKATCAHELTHAWLFENVPARRKKTLGHDANEGFCELVAYLLMDSQHEEEEMKAIRRNNYTRGQIHLFIEAEKRYGFNEIAEWMKYGVDPVLDKNDVNNVRKIQITAPIAAKADDVSTYITKPRAPERLTLHGISWNKNRSLAVINNRTFEEKERGSVRLGNTNVVIRCLQINTNSVVVQIDGRADKQVLELIER